MHSYLKDSFTIIDILMEPEKQGNYKHLQRRVNLKNIKIELSSVKPFGFTELDEF